MSPSNPHRDLRWLQTHRAEVLSCAAKHGAHNVRVFGSVAKGEANEASDIDLLVEMEVGRSLLDLIGLEQDLADLLNGPVHVVSDRGLSPHLRERILAEAVVL